MTHDDAGAKARVRMYVIPEDELLFRFIRSPGPGGQNVNKVATAVELRFDVTQCASLPADVKERLMSRYAKRINKDGVLIIMAHRFRSQERNREDAMERLHELIATVATAPKARRPTKPTHSSKQRRLEGKARRSMVKQHRKRPGADD